MGLFDSLPPPSANKAAQRAVAKRPAADQPENAAEIAVVKRLKAADSTPVPLHRVQLPCVALSAAFSEDKGSRLTMEDAAVINIEATVPAAAAPAGASTTSGHTGAVPSSVSAPTGVRLSFFAITDGHGGANVARFAAENLNAAVMEAGLAAEAQRLAEAAASALASVSGGLALGDGVQAAACPQPSLKQCRAAITDGFRELDRKVLERCAAEGWPDGCTAVAVWVLGDTALVANVGDARCVLARRPAAPASGGSKGAQGASASGGSEGGAAAASGGSEGGAAVARGSEGGAAATAGGSEGGAAAASGGSKGGAAVAAAEGGQGGRQGEAAQQEQPPEQTPQQAQQQQPEHLKAVTLTREHKPVFPGERQRIEKAGGFVSTDGRLAGRIEVSRAFGDRQFKRSGMSAAPDVQAFQIGPREAFLLLACDGFWGVFTPQDAVDFAQREMALKGHGPKQTCNRLLHEAIRERRCKDNCTVMLVKFG